MVVDDLALAPVASGVRKEQCRLGHNGLKSIIAVLAAVSPGPFGDWASWACL